MKLPTELEVMGRVIPIKYIHKDDLNQMITGAEGIWDTYTRTIYINHEAPIEVKFYYSFHEAGHAVMTFTGLDQVIAPELQEIIVQTFATLIEDILKQSNKFKVKRTRRKK